MFDDLSGTSVLITGASSGIGAAVARGFGRGGAIWSSTDPAAGPEMRTTATPALPWPLERAKMVALSLMERAIGSPVCLLAQIPLEILAHRTYLADFQRIASLPRSWSALIT